MLFVHSKGKWQCSAACRVLSSSAGSAFMPQQFLMLIMRHNLNFTTGCLAAFSVNTLNSHYTAMLLACCLHLQPTQPCCHIAALAGCISSAESDGRLLWRSWGIAAALLPLEKMCPAGTLHDVSCLMGETRLLEPACVSLRMYYIDAMAVQHAAVAMLVQSQHSMWLRVGQEWARQKQSRD